MRGKKEHKKPIILSMDMEEAMERFSKVTKEEIQELKPKGELVQEGESQLELFKGKEIR